MDNLQDLKISGMSQMNGGKYNYVEISGMGKIISALEANRIKISGSGSVEGDVKANKIDIEGTCHVKGNIDCNLIENSGMIKIRGNLKAEVLTCKGMSTIGGAIKVKKLLSHGVLKTGGDVEAEEFDSEGAFAINGLLNANSIHIKVGYGCTAKEIGGEEIIVRKLKTFGLGVALMLIGKSKILKTELIEGTKIDIEHTEAKIIRGENIKIGPKCIIDLIEYSGELVIDSNSVVKEQRKV